MKKRALPLLLILCSLHSFTQCADGGDADAAGAAVGITQRWTAGHTTATMSGAGIVIFTALAYFAKEVYAHHKEKNDTITGSLKQITNEHRHTLALLQTSGNKSEDELKFNKSFMQGFENAIQENEGQYAYFFYARKLAQAENFFRSNKQLLADPKNAELYAQITKLHAVYNSFFASKRDADEQAYRKNTTALNDLETKELSNENIRLKNILLKTKIALFQQTPIFQQTVLDLLKQQAPSFSHMDTQAEMGLMLGTQNKATLVNVEKELKAVSENVAQLQASFQSFAQTQTSDTIETVRKSV